jgi:hypothetical protein
MYWKCTAMPLLFTCRRGGSVLRLIKIVPATVLAALVAVIS